MATEVQWIVTLAYPIGMLVLEQILIAGVKLGPKITLDVIEEMLDVENAKEVVRNIYTNIALVSALLLTVTFAMLQADRPSCESCDPRLILESLYITATWTACLCHIRVTLECVINLVYTESLPHYMVLRYVIAFPGSVGGPVIALSMAVVNMLFSAAVWLTMEYSAAAGVGFGVMSVFYVIFLSILARVKSNFSATRGTLGPPDGKVGMGRERAWIGELEFHHNRFSCAFPTQQEDPGISVQTRATGERARRRCAQGQGSCGGICGSAAQAKPDQSRILNNKQACSRDPRPPTPNPGDRAAPHAEHARPKLWPTARTASAASSCAATSARTTRSSARS